MNWFVILIAVLALSRLIIGLLIWRDTDDTQEQEQDYHT